MMHKKTTQFALVAMLLSAPIFMGQKGCEKPEKWEHPVVNKDAQCSDCHDDGRTRETKPKSHNLSWSKEHGNIVKRYGLKPQSTCMQCHKESACVQCHQQEKPKSHTEFFRLKGHGLEVGMDRSRCFACHRGADFCEKCHSETTPLDHNAAWGTPSNRHCLSCHFPLTSVGAQVCATCHSSTPSHANAPLQPSNALHVTGANCRSCHTPLRHPDNGMVCTTCHKK